MRHHKRSALAWNIRALLREEISSIRNGCRLRACRVNYVLPNMHNRESSVPFRPPCFENILQPRHDVHGDQERSVLAWNVRAFPPWGISSIRNGCRHSASFVSTFVLLVDDILKYTCCSCEPQEKIPSCLRKERLQHFFVHCRDARFASFRFYASKHKDFENKLPRVVRREKIQHAERPAYQHNRKHSLISTVDPSK